VINSIYDNLYYLIGILLTLSDAEGMMVQERVFQKCQMEIVFYGDYEARVGGNCAA
jgi:hypothetical protein